MESPLRFAFDADGTAVHRCVRCMRPINRHAAGCAAIGLETSGDDRACEACGFIVCTDECRATVAKALAEIEAQKRAAQDRESAPRAAAPLCAAPDADDAKAWRMAAAKSPTPAWPIPFVVEALPARFSRAVVVRSPVAGFLDRLILESANLDDLIVSDVRVGKYSMLGGPEDASGRLFGSRGSVRFARHPGTRVQIMMQDLIVLLRNRTDAPVYVSGAFCIEPI